MRILTEITANIIKNVKDGDTIHKLAKRIGFAYSAVYKWINILEDYEVVYLIKRGNKTIIKVNKNLIYKKFMELNNAISIAVKDKIFWKLVKNSSLRIRFVRGTAITIWTQGSFITGDFFDRIYFLEVERKHLSFLKKSLTKNDITFTFEKLTKARPLVFIIPKKEFKITRKNNLPVMPLNELITWCKKLSLDNVLEQLDLLYNLNLGVKYSEIKTNV